MLPAVCRSPDGEHCASALNSALSVTSTFFYTDPIYNTAMTKVLFLPF